MRGLRIRSFGGDLVDEEVADPVCGPDEVLVRVEACSVGMTVLNCIRGDLGHDPAHLPLVPGHELVGTVQAVGAGVDDAVRGQRVAAYFYLFCGTCDRCLAGAEDLCRNLKGYLGVDRDGGYAEMVAIPARNAVRLPDDLDPILATVIPDAVATPVHIARRAQIAPGQKVVVVGAGGGVGIHMVQVARAFGAEVAALDVSPAKLRVLSDELECAAFDSSDLGSIKGFESWLRGAKPDLVIDFIGNPTTLTWSVAALGTGGKLVTLTTFLNVDFPLSPREVVLRELSVLGSRYASRYELHLAAQMVVDGKVRPMIGRREGPDGVPAIHRDLASGQLLGRGALVW